MRKNLKISQNISNIIKDFSQIYGINLNDLSKKIDVQFRTLRSYISLETMPPLRTIKKIANFFGISIDFLLSKNTSYITDIRFFSLAEQIDKFNPDEWYRIQSAIITFLGRERRNEKVNMNFDDNIIITTPHVHQNIKILRENANMSQIEIGEKLGLSNSIISYYESGDSIPPFESILKLSDIFNVSVHMITTGQKLYFQFKNAGFKDAILLAETFISMKDRFFLYEMMQNIIENNKTPVTVPA